MPINTFDDICAAMKIGPTRPTAVLSDGPPRLVARYRAPGAEFEEAIIVEMDNSPIHVTIYKSSWDGTVMVPGNFGLVPVGPNALHLTSGNRWFYVVESDGSLRSLHPDIGLEPTDRTRRAMNDVFMPVLGQCLLS